MGRETRASAAARVTAHTSGSRLANNHANSVPRSPADLLREYVSWFMTGERLEQRLLNSDGALAAINAEWGPGAGDQQREAAIELRFSNNMATTPPYHIIGLTAADIETVLGEVAGTGFQPSAVDPAILHRLERVACCKLTAHEAAMLKQAKVDCPICLAPFAARQAALFLPCGRASSAPANPASSTEGTCLGHMGHLRCLRAAFQRHDACPLCRTKLVPSPSKEEPAAVNEAALSEALDSAQRNLQNLRKEAEHLRHVSKVAMIAGAKRGGGAVGGSLHTNGPASSARSRQLIQSV